MIRLSTLRALAVVALLGAAAPSHAQVGSGAPATSEAAGAPAPGQAAPAAASASQTPVGGGLPQRAAPPRTLRAYWHLFGAYAVTCILIFAYALSLGRRFSRLEESVERLGRGV